MEAPDLATRQLAAIGDVGDKLAVEGVEWWLHGGWAVDFHVGRVTRPHDDVDLAVWLDDVPRVAELLERSGWRHAPEADEDGGTGFELCGVRLELTYIVRGEDGQVYTPLRDGRPRWPDGAFSDDVGRLGSSSARIVALAALVSSKSRGRDDPADAAKDEADAAALAGVGGLGG